MNLKAFSKIRMLHPPLSSESFLSSRNLPRRLCEEQYGSGPTFTCSALKLDPFCSFASAGTRPQDCYIPQSWVTQGTVTLQTFSICSPRHDMAVSTQWKALGAIRTLLAI
jgi:hypothetical protein